MIINPKIIKGAETIRKTIKSEYVLKKKTEKIPIKIIKEPPTISHFQEI